jgi:phospholipase C
MGHFTGAQLPFYYSLASQFPIGDRYFCSVMAQTYPNRRFLIAAGQLPQFSLVDPYTNYSEEDGDISIGEAFAARIIGAVMASPNWSSTAMFLVYDEHGGWYDHVPPQPAVRPDNVPPEITVPPDQPGGYDQTGFRVPCVVISPFARLDFVSHVVHDHTSLLKFMETKWNLPAMTYRDANATNMFEFFDFEWPAFAEPPTVAAPLNPFVGPLPADSGSPGFHPIATGVAASTLPPAGYTVSTPPRRWW